MKVAIYARYSSDNQRDASIADQLRICREFAARQGWVVVQEFTDHAISGATLLRSGFQALMRDALNQRFDIVLAESLDRFSRDQEDTAGLFKRLTFAGVNIVTLNELYIGRLIWNRLRYVKNPDTGKRISRLNPNAEWITKEIPSLRIVSDELWNAAKDRQSATRRTITRTGNIGFARRPQYLFSGLSKCGICGAGFIMAGRNRLACFGAREKGTCDNRLTIRRDEVEARVLTALQQKLLRQDMFDEFCEEFTREMTGCECSIAPASRLLSVKSNASRPAARS